MTPRERIDAGDTIQHGTSLARFGRSWGGGIMNELALFAGADKRKASRKADRKSERKGKA